MISMVCGRQSLSTKNVLDLDLETLRVSDMASAAAVPSSNIDALAISKPVRSVTMVWKLIKASNRP